MASCAEPERTAYRNLPFHVFFSEHASVRRSSGFVLPGDSFPELTRRPRSGGDEAGKSWNVRPRSRYGKTDSTLSNPLIIMSMRWIFFCMPGFWPGSMEFRFPPEFDETLQRMLNALLLLGRAGVPPSIGDDDGGRLFDPRRNRAEHLLDPLATGAVLYRRGDFKSRRGWSARRNAVAAGQEGPCRV